MQQTQRTVHNAGYKETEFGWLPEEWESVKIGDINSEKKEGLTPSDFPEEIFEYYSIPAYQENRKPISEKGKNILSQKLLLKNGTILFGKLNPRVEKVWLVESETENRMIGSTEWIPIIPDNNTVDPKFLYYLEWSKYVMPVAKTLVSGSTPSRQRVDPTAFYRIKVPLPPLAEQRNIAAVLATLQAAQETTAQVIAALKELKKSLLKHLFTYGPVRVQDVEQVSLKETEIGLMPKEWEVKSLVDIATLQRGKDLPKQNQVIGGYPIVGSSGILGYHNEYFCEGPGIVTGRRTWGRTDRDALKGHCVTAPRQGAWLWGASAWG